MHKQQLETFSGVIQQGSHYGAAMDRPLFTGDRLYHFINLATDRP